MAMIGMSTYSPISGASMPYFGDDFCYGLALLLLFCYYCCLQAYRGKNFDRLLAK